MPFEDRVKIKIGVEAEMKLVYESLTLENLWKPAERRTVSLSGVRRNPIGTTLFGKSKKFVSQMINSVNCRILILIVFSN